MEERRALAEIPEDYMAAAAAAQEIIQIQEGMVRQGW
jgi:hypothetical protein